MTDTAATPDFAALWTDAQARVVALVQDLSEEELQGRVPACPDWSVKDLLAHMVGVGASALDGDVHPESDDWTATHVRDRSDQSARQILDEWLRIGPQVEELARTAPPADAVGLVADVAIHEQDMRGALGEADARTGPALRAAADFLASGLGEKLAGAGLPPLQLASESEGWSAVAGDGQPAATMGTSVYEVTRSVTGRRSTSQVRAYDWEGDPTPYLQELSLFGPLRDSDLVE